MAAIMHRSCMVANLLLDTITLCYIHALACINYNEQTGNNSDLAIYTSCNVMRFIMLQLTYTHELIIITQQLSLRLP